MIKLNTKYLEKFVTIEEINNLMPKIKNIKNNQHQLLGANLLGWQNINENTDIIKKYAKKIQQESEYLIVIGIGGSYLGAKSAIDIFTPSFNELKTTKVIFVGNNLSTKYINDVINLINNKDFSINVISKSGSTIEPAIAFRIFKKLLQEKYENYQTRIYSTTSNCGILYEMSVKEKYNILNIPNNIGGRYSVLTDAGLLPMLVSGINIDQVLNGALTAKKNFENINNSVYIYSAIRNILYQKNYQIELFVAYDSKYQMLNEWLKQLFGESEGKEDKGLLPTSATFSTDLHSLGQFIQEGSKVLFETILQVETPTNDLLIPKTSDDLDCLNYLAGKSVDFVNKKACEGTIEAHVETGKVPNIILTMDRLDAKNFGYMVYFFELACAMSVYLLDVNPFNQPGVEVYKANMFKLLGKPSN